MTVAKQEHRISLSIHFTYIRTYRPRVRMFRMSELCAVCLGLEGENLIKIKVPFERRATLPLYYGLYLA